MQDKLKKITDKTMVQLIKEDVVLPSSYFETFHNEAKGLELHNTADIEIEINKMLQNEVEKINDLSAKTIKNMEEFILHTSEANEAFIHQDYEKIISLQNHVKTLQEDMESILSDIYYDNLTKTYNKQWIFKNYLDDNDRIKETTQTLYLKIHNYDYICNEYGELIANNIVKFFVNMVKKFIQIKESDYSFIRFTDDTFIIFIKNDSPEIVTIMQEIQEKLDSSTLKTKSGLMIKTNFEFIISKSLQKQYFYDLIEDLDMLLTEKRLGI